MSDGLNVHYIGHKTTALCSKYTFVILVLSDVIQGDFEGLVGINVRSLNDSESGSKLSKTSFQSP